MRLEDGRHALFYSGDGLFSPETLLLARGCDLAIHEAFQLDPVTPAHGTVRQCLDFAREAGVATLALVHVQRDEEETGIRRSAVSLKMSGTSTLSCLKPVNCWNSDGGSHPEVRFSLWAGHVHGPENKPLLHPTPSCKKLHDNSAPDPL